MRETWRWLHPYAQVVGQHATDLLVEAHGPTNGRHAMEPIEPNAPSLLSTSGPTE